jgi:hypothetical protein
MADRISYRNLLVGAYEFYQAQMLNNLVTLNPKTHYESVTNQIRTKTINYGDIRLSNIRKYLDLFPSYTRCVLMLLSLLFSNYLYYFLIILFSNYVLTLFLFYRSEMQKKFHESFLQVIISFIIFFFLHSLLILTLFLFYNRRWLYICKSVVLKIFFTPVASLYLTLLLLFFYSDTRTTPRQVLNFTNVL